MVGSRVLHRVLGLLQRQQRPSPPPPQGQPQQPEAGAAASPCAPLPPSPPPCPQEDGGQGQGQGQERVGSGEGGDASLLQQWLAPEGPSRRAAPGGGVAAAAAPSLPGHVHHLRVPEAAAVEGRAHSLTQLYTHTLPSLRRELKRKVLRQVGCVTPGVDRDTFRRFRYWSMHRPGPDGKQMPHNPYSPKALQDSTLELFEPRKWQADLPPDPDELPFDPADFLRAELGLQVGEWAARGEAESILSSGVRALCGQPVEYCLHLDCQVEAPWGFVLVLTTSDATSGRPISQQEKHLDPVQEGQLVVFAGPVPLDTEALPGGRYAVEAVLFFKLRHGKRLLLRSFPPMLVTLLESESAD